MLQDLIILTKINSEITVDIIYLINLFNVKINNNSNVQYH